MTTGGEYTRNEQSSTKEILYPRDLPAIAFQSYEMLASGSVDVRPAFIAGQSRNPKFENPKLKIATIEMAEGIMSLDGARRRVELVEQDAEHLGVINSTIDYRIAEMEYVKLLSQLDYLVHETGDIDAAREVALQVKEASERLYGEADPYVRDMCLNAIWRNLDGKQFQGKARQLYDDLRYGFTMAEGYEISAMRRSDDQEAMFPEFGEAATWAGEYFQEKNADIFALADEFWAEKVVENGEEFTCSTDDMIEFLEAVIRMRDPDNFAGIIVEKKPKSAALSWNTSNMTLYVGATFGNRAVPIDTAMIMATRTLHEFGQHGQTAINGLKTDLPVLGTGLYTDTSNPDYLPFEEGFATIIESAIDGDQPEWEGGGLSYYLGVAFAAEGDDFRTVYEKTWRYIVLQETPEDQLVTDEAMKDAQRKAYMRCARIFRGNPTDAGSQLGVVTTYNKDLSYIAGKIRAIQYIKRAYEQGNTAFLDLALLGKADLTNPVHFEIALAAYERAGMFYRSLLTPAA
jgi:hypothetical protein